MVNAGDGQRVAYRLQNGKTFGGYQYTSLGNKRLKITSVLDYSGKPPFICWRLWFADGYAIAEDMESTAMISVGILSSKNQPDKSESKHSKKT
jgi:hypothetical protein